MTEIRGEMEARGDIAAAAALIGAPIEFHDGDDWEVREGIIVVGLAPVRAALASGGDAETAVASALLILWESVREVRALPLRRARRLALSARRPELEPLLACVDRALAASELRSVMPALRAPIARAVAAGLPEHPGELPRHLQWVTVALIAVLDPAAAVRATAALDPEVSRELGRLGGLDDSADDASDEAAGARFVQRACAAGTGIGAMRRFEQAVGVLLPPYERLLALDRSERGLTAAEAARAEPPDTDDDAPAGTGGTGASDTQDPGTAGDASTGDAEPPARPGDRADAAEGADLFAAEQAGFVETVLATPLPAHGAWAGSLEVPELEAEHDPAAARQPQRAEGGRSAGLSGTQSYRERRRAHAESIDALREAWRRVIADRVSLRRSFTRTPAPEGDVLAPEAFVRIVAETTAGVDRPHAFVSREQRPKRSRRAGSTDYVLLIDRSSSMQGAPAEAAADAALIMLESLAAVERDIAEEERALGIDLELGLRTALIVFDSVPVVVKPLSGALDDGIRRRMHAEVRASGGTTDDAAALRAAGSELGVGNSSGGDGTERRRVVILVSDGGTDDGGSAQRELRALRAAGVTVYGIGLRTGDLVSRYAPDGARLDDPAQLAGEIARLIERTGADRT